VFKNGCTSVKLEEGVGRLSKSITDKNIERVRDMILQNRQMSVDEVAHQPEISHRAACEVIHHKTAFHTVRSQ
jgi:response regulator of citrate/malate metabolism